MKFGSAGFLFAEVFDHEVFGLTHVLYTEATRVRPRLPHKFRLILFTLLALVLTASANPADVGGATLKDVTQSSAYVEQYVRVYFSDIPALAEVAKCESRFRQFDKHGNVLRGEENPRDVGVMQINERFHLDTALEEEIDIYTLEGNLEYARHLHERMGIEPWKHSKKCWKHKVLALK